jgi:hypothetical protein
MVVGSPDAGSAILSSELPRSLPPPLPVTPTIAAAVSADHHLIIVLSICLVIVLIHSPSYHPTLLLLLAIVLYGLLVFFFPTPPLVAAALLHSSACLRPCRHSLLQRGRKHLLSNQWPSKLAGTTHRTWPLLRPQNAGDPFDWACICRSRLAVLPSLYMDVAGRGATYSLLWQDCLNAMKKLAHSGAQRRDHNITTYIHSSKDMLKEDKSSKNKKWVAQTMHSREMKIVAVKPHYRCEIIGDLVYYLVP